MKEKNIFKRLMVFAIATTMCMTILAVLPTINADCPGGCPSGMVSYWKLDEGSGTIAYDYYGSNDGTNNGATINQPGQVAKAYSFDGVDDYIEVPSDPSLEISDEITLEAWIKPAAVNNERDIIQKRGEVVPGLGKTNYELLIYNGNLQFRFFDTAWRKLETTGNPISAGQWYHVAATFNNGATRLYVNGIDVKDGTLPSTMPTYATPLRIGVYDAFHAWFSGIIDEVAIYNGVLTANEISYHYHAGLAGHGYCECPDTVYVDDDYYNGGYNDGHTWGYDAFDNIQDGVDAVCGSTVYVLPGLYTPTSMITITTDNLNLIGPQAGVDPRPFGGTTRTPGDTLTEAVIDGGGTLQYILEIMANDVTIDGLEVRHGTKDLVCQSYSYSGTVVKNCIVHDSQLPGDEGIQLLHCVNGLITCNYIYDVAQDGVCLSYSTNCAILGNEINNSNSDNGAIYVYNSEDTIIDSNYIHDTTAANGIKLYESEGDTTMKNNLIVQNDWIIKSWKHPDYSGNGILGYKYTKTGSTLTIAHNTISDNNLDPASVHYGDTDFGNGIGINTEASYDGILDIFNNIIANNGLPSYGWGLITKLYHGCPGPTPANCNIDYNDIYNNGAGVCSGTFCPIGANNIYLDPQFVGTSDYHLQSSRISAWTGTL